MKVLPPLSPAGEAFTACTAFNVVKPSSDDTFVFITGTYIGFSLKYLNDGSLILTLRANDNDDNNIYTVKLNVISTNCKLEYARYELNCPLGSDDGINNADFHPVNDFTLLDHVLTLAQNSKWILVAGYSSDGVNIHDVHLNRGDMTWTKWPGRPSDGFIGFIKDYDADSEILFLKFSTQYLNESQYMQIKSQCLILADGPKRKN